MHTIMGLPPQTQFWIGFDALKHLKWLQPLKHSYERVPVKRRFDGANEQTKILRQNTLYNQSSKNSENTTWTWYFIQSIGANNQ